ncbi:MAG TPA: dephospho-CoA kinase [Anaerolineales bacterium]|jgi:dephospho-CoA kinase|nr:dephospho-CoA kinase [Anaerolineales bacterium]
MSAWQDKFVIGLTGNIATGKSVVRKMLEHLGAYGIDADALGRRAIAEDAPGYEPVVDTFGKWIVAPDGQIDRAKLARVVFSDPQALTRLESIVHPLVGQAVDLLMRRSVHKVVVVEAIKLLESGLGAACDSIWVTVAPEKIQLTRLVRKRGMAQADAWQRIKSQPPQQDKVAAAHVIINNDGGFEQIWEQVEAAWQETVASPGAAQIEPQAAPENGFLVGRARLQQAKEIADFATDHSRGRRRMTEADVVAAFSEKAFLVLRKDGKLVGMVGWQVENLVARTSDVYLDGSVYLEKGMSLLISEVERASHELQCEVSLLFIPPSLARHEAVWRNLHYEPRTIQNLKVRAWQEAAEESMPKGTLLLFKQLRKDRVLRPV